MCLLRRWSLGCGISTQLTKYSTELNYFGNQLGLTAEDPGQCILHIQQLTYVRSGSLWLRNLVIAIFVENPDSVTPEVLEVSEF
jgi:hypothetical protein